MPSYRDVHQLRILPFIFRGRDFTHSLVSLSFQAQENFRLLSFHALHITINNPFWFKFITAPNLRRGPVEKAQNRCDWSATLSKTVWLRSRHCNYSVFQFFSKSLAKINKCAQALFTPGCPLIRSHGAIKSIKILVSK